MTAEPVAREYVTEAWSPEPAPDWRHSLHMPMRPVEPLPDLEPEPEIDGPELCIELELGR
jgi:hypothetical protein